MIWLEPAIEDPRELIGFIAADNAIAARELGTRILDAVEVLSHFPASGCIYPALKRRCVRYLSDTPVGGWVTLRVTQSIMKDLE